MTTLIRRMLEPDPSIASPLAASFLWQMDDQSRRLSEDAGQINLLRHQYRLAHPSR